MRRAALSALALMAALAAMPALAQPADELESLKQEQARLRQSLDAIDRRIRALEEARGTPASAPALAPAVDRAAVGSGNSLVALQRNWAEIKPGIARARVDELLGTPDREMHINGDLVWYYVYPTIGRGSVFFSESDKVTAVQAPISGWGR